MHSPKRKNQRLYLTLALIGLLILFSWSKLAEARPPTAKQHLEQAWRIAADAGRFEYQTNVEQITRPTARLENAGRSSTSQQLRAEGWVNRADNAMQLRLWSSQAGQRGIELKVEGERAYGRTSANDVWAEIPNPTNIFAPGGDPLGFLVAAENVRAGDGGQGLERQELTLDDVLGNPQLANPNSQLPGSTSYTFDLSGPRYADYVHDQLETAMRERGDLPPGVNLGLVRQFAGMTGHGEIWLDAEGLPIQQVIHLEFPAARGALDRMDADITTTFRGWESAGRGVGTGALVRQTWQDPQFLVQQFLSSKSLKEISMALGASLLMAALALMAFTYRRSLKFYRAVILALIAVMVVTPLLQSHHVHAFNSGQQQRQVDFEQRQQAAQQNADAQAGLDSDFDPTLNPLEARNQEVVVEGAVSQVPNSYSLRADLEPAAAAAAATAQTSLSGCDYDTDSDGDTLTDYTECYKLDTFTDTVDSDIDGISDITEVQGFTLNGQQWYLNPLDTDSNGDGFADAVECPALADVDEMGNLTNPFGSTCVDTDGDNTPDVFDFDNDGDGVPDRIDASPNYVGNLSTNAANDFSLALDGHDAAGRMLVVDFQLRPTNIDHLFQTNNVFDWPENDTQGQITRINDNTLADLGYNGPRTNRGDIILSPMLEIKIPDPTNNSNNPSGGLPVRSDFNGDYAASPLTDWLDTDTLDHFNITVNHDETDDTLTAYMPLTLVEDTLGDTPVAWGTQMVYQPEGSLWGDDHKVRLVWLVQALLDSCDISGIGENDTYDEWCATNSGNWVTSMAVIQTYYEDFTLTGLSVREDYGMDMAVIAQTDALTVDYENYLWHLSNNLLATFGEGRLIDDDNDDIGDRRFDFDEIITRFGGTSGTMWDIPVNLIAVDSVTYTNQITGLAGMFNTQIPNVLSTHYSGAATDDDVTLLFAREESYKTTSLGSASVDDAVFGKLTVSLGGLTQQTYSTLNWSPYQYDASGEWLSKDLYDYYDILETKLTSAISNGEIDSMLGWFGESGQEFSTLTKGAIGLARNYYTTMYMGSSNPVFDSDYGNISDAVVVDNVLDMDFDDDGSPDEAALLIVGTSLGLMQLFFQREGDLILDQVYEILWTIGEIEKDIDDDDDDSLAQTLAIAGIQLSKSLIKKLVSELEGKVRGTVKYYKYSSRTSQATTSISMLSGAIAAANFLYFDSENQYLTFASNTLDLAEVAIDTADTAYTYYRMTQGFGVTDIMLVETTTSKLESSTKTSAIIGLVIDIAVASTIFAFSVKNAPPGSMAFNAALAQFIADIITAIIIAIIAATLIGSLVLAVIGLIDAVIAAVCRWNGQDEPKAVEVWVCGGIESAFTTALRYAIYDQYVLVDMDKTNRLSIGMHDPVLQQIGDTSGYVVGNELQVGATVTTSLSLNDPTGIVRTTYVKNGKLDRDTLGRLMRKSTFAYKLQHGEYDIHSNLDKGDVDWGSDNTGIFAATTAVPLDTPGINYSLPLYLTEGFHVNVIECWGFVGAVEEISCKQRSLKGSSHIYLGDDFTMDILPATLDEFISVTPLGNQSYRLSWDTRFSTLIDGDGDGLRSKATGGPDPDDNTWDADSDGLSDFWELDNGFDPLQADGDNDNLFDYWEAFYNTNPRLADTDSDGLLDGEEFYHSQSRHPFVDESQPWSGGWDIIYPTLGGQTDTAWVSADPLAYDGDNDSISDKREQVYGYNPNLASVLNILTLNSEVSSPAVQPGGTLAYTATIKNELDGRTLNGLLQAELPVDVVRNTEVMAQLAPLQTITMSGQLTVPVVAQSTPTSLTLRAGVAVSSSIVEANPPGPVFYLDEFNFNPTSGYNQFDDSGYNHTVTCNASSTSISCPGDGSAIVNDGFSFNLDDNRMDVNGRNSLKLGSNGNTFSMMMWINPRQGYSPDNDYYNEFGVNVLGQNFYASPKNDFPSLTLKGRKVQIHFGHQDGLGYCLATSSSILTYNEWQHLAVIFDGGQFQFYLDGVLAETETGDNCAGQDLYPAKDFTIGQTDGAAAYFRRLEPRNASLDEGYIWSNDNIFYNNGATYRESECCYSTSDNPKLIWYSKEFHIHIQPNGDKYISYPDAWAVSGKSDLTFWVCNLDEEDVVGAPNGCLSSDNNSDEPMYYKKNGSKEYERIYSSTYSPAQYVLEYDKGYKNNKWGAYIDFDLYNNAFLGDLDEIALYNTNLSQESVEDIYIASLRTAYLTFDEPPGQDSFEDATAYATVATCSGANCPDSGIPGRDNQALRFDGIDDYVQFPQPLDSAAQLFTAAAWFKIDNLDTNQAILQQQDGSSTGRTWLWVLSNGQIRTFLGGSNLDSGAGNVVTPGSWHHAAVAANSGTVKLYLDGQLVNQASQSVQASDGGLLIGAHKSLSSGFFDGLIDEVVIQRGALNVSQTVQLMLEAPVLNLHLDENLNVTNFSDDTPYANDATCSANTCPGTGTKGQIREAIVLERNDVITTSIANVNIDKSNFSVAMWVRPDQIAASGDQNLIDMDRFRLYMPANSTQLEAVIWAGCNRAVNLSGADLTPNQWNHIAFTIERDGALSGSGRYPATLFLNGAQVDQQYTAGSQSVCDGMTETPIWGDNFIGDMDEISIFGVALRGSEIKDLYDYQAAWFDQSAVHRIMIDTDDPQVSLGLATGYLPLAETLLSIDAFDVSSGIASVQVTVIAPDGITVTNATRSDDPDSKAWFYSFNPNVAGEYTIDLLATDLAGNTGVGSTTFDVDDTPPSASLDSSLTANAQQTTSSEGKRSLNIFGPISDSVSPASGVASNTIAVEMLDWQGLSVGGSQFAAYSGEWQVDYPFATLSYGQYDVHLSAEDIAGNVYSATIGSVDVDDMAPSADVILDSTLITKTGAVLTGTVTDIPYPNQSKRLHLHFEESSGATQFSDGSADHLAAACVTDCPSAGQSGAYGDAVAFDGTNNVLTVSTTINPISHTFTALSWFNLTDTSAEYSLLAQESDPTWLSVLGSARLNTSLGGSDLTGPTSVTPGQWHHAAVSYDGELVSLYLDGLLEMTATHTLAFNDGDMIIGADGSFGSLFKGRLDEVALYDSALTGDQIYDIANPLNTGVISAEIRFRHLQYAEQDENDGDWYSLTLASPGQNFSEWTYSPPNDLEGPYKIDLRATDEAGNTGFLPNMWTGNIDLVAPRLTLNYVLLSDQLARAECYAYDFNIASAGWACPADNPVAVPTSSDWFVQIFTDTTNTTAYSTTLQTVSSQSDTLTACDIFGHCATTTITNPTLLAESISIITPTETAVYTGLFPIEVAGYARSHLQIQTTELFINGQLEYDEFHGLALTETNWSTYWQPEQPGTHTLEAELTTWAWYDIIQIVDPVQVEVHFIAPKLNITNTITPANPGLGDLLTYTIIVSNSGNLDADNVRITDTLPAVLTGPDLDETVTLPVGAVVSYTIPAMVTSEYVNIANTAWVSHTWERNSALSLVFDCNRFEVLNDHDSGIGSLRHAIENTCGSSLITFGDNFTIEIASTLEIDNTNITIDASDHNVTLSSDPDLYNYRKLSLLDVSAGSGLTLTNLTAIHGRPAIRSRGALSVFSSTLHYNTQAIDHNSPDPLLVSHSTFYWNLWPFSENGTGLYLAGGGVATVTHSLFQRNFARAAGAGIYNNGSTLTVINSTFYDNSTFLSNRGGGAGIYNNGQASIIHSTFSGNHTSLSSSAYRAFSADIHHNSSQPLLLANSIFANSKRGRNCTTAGNGPITTINTLIEDNTCGATFSGDPILSDLDDYGGQTESYALQPQSPAIDAADPAYCPGDDQRDLARPHGSACDLGAFESQGYTIVTDGSEQSAPVNTTFGHPLSVTVYHAATGVPVENGVPIMLTSPAVGAGLTPVQSNGSLNGQGHYEKAVTANGNGGTYLVTATVTGVSQSANFTLTNLAADLVISKSLLITTPVPGQPISYTITFSNAGNTSTSNVIITDTLPPEMTVSQVISNSDVPLAHTVSNQTFEVFETSAVLPGQRGVITLTGLLTDSLSLAHQAIVNQVEIEGAVLEAITENNVTTVSSLALCYPVSRLYVDADATGGANTGITWTDAITKLQDALSAADDCGYAEEIWVAEGIYYPDEGVGFGDDNRNAYFTLQNGLALYGGFDGSETLLSQRNYTTNVTILSGDISQNDTTSAGIVTDASLQNGDDNTRHVVYAINSDSTAILDGFTVTAGRATAGTGFGRMGGGLFMTSGNPTLRNLIFSGNYAQQAGGGLYSVSGNVNLLNVTFVGNQSINNGGGIYQANGQSTMEQVIFKGNWANNGGGIYSFHPLIITNGLFSGNDATSAGGAIDSQSNLTLLNVTFGGNSAGNSTDAIYSHSFNPLNNTLTNVVMWNNGDDNDTTPFDNVDSFNISYSVIQGGCPSGATCSNVLDDSPLFVSSPDPASAPTQVGDLRLLFGSSAIDAGTNNGAPTDDIRGVDRPVNGVVDAGAYESQGFTLAYGSGSDQVAVIGNAFSAPLVVTVTSSADDPVGPGGQVLFNGPTTGASLFDNPSTGQTDVDGVVKATVIANGITGSYIVTTTANGVTGQATFALTNTEAALVLLKQVSPVSAEPGETVTYTLVFSNGGITPIPGVIITDNIPISMTIQQFSSGGDVAITRTVNGQTAQVFEVATLDPDDEGVITLTTQLTSPLASGPLRNTAILTSQIVSGGSTELVAVELLVLNVAPIVTGTTISTSEKTANDTVIGMVTSSDANNDVLSYTISGGNPGAPFGIDATGQIVINDNRSLDFETQPQYILTVEANDGGLTATTAVTVNLTDVDTDLTLAKAAISNLAADASVPTDYLSTPGETITYTLTFRNDSGDDAVGIVITDALPAQFTIFGSPQITIPASSTITQTGTNPLQWEINGLAAGEQGVITLTGLVTDTLGLTVFTNTAYITSTTPDVNLANNLAEGAIMGCGFNIEVQNNSDAGSGSLRQAIADLCEGGTVTFASDMTITLPETDPSLSLERGLTIDGTGHDVIIAGDSSAPLFQNDDPTFSINQPSGSVTLTQLTVSNALGPAIRMAKANVTVISMTVTNGIRMAEGGYIELDGGASLTLVGSSIVSNTGSGMSGILVFSGTAEIVNSTIAYNVFDTGGNGLSVFDGAVTVTHSTIVANGTQSGSSGLGNVAAENSGDGTITLQHSIVAGGIDNGIIGDLDCSGTMNRIIDAGYNLLGSTCSISTATSSHVDSSRVFTDILTPWGEYGPSAGSGQATPTFALLPGSPALDGGSSGSCVVATDQRGLSRPYGDACDIGAFESRGYSLALVGSNQNTFINTPFATPLQVTLVSGDSGVPVGGRVITLTAPIVGASITTPTITATTNAAGVVSATVTANGSTGSYAVGVTAADMPPTAFNLSNVLPNVDLQITKQVTPTTVDPGQAVTFTLSFANNGLSTATGVVMTDIVPSQLSAISYQSSADGGVAITHIPDTMYEWTVSDLAFGQGGVITITGIVTQPLVGGLFTNTATITTVDDDDDAGNNRADVGLTVRNITPTLVITDEIRVITGTGTITISFATTDVNGDNLIYSLVDPWPGMNITNDGIFTWQPPEVGYDAVYSVTVMVSEGSGGAMQAFALRPTALASSEPLTNSQTIYIVVYDTNEAPFFTSVISDQTVTEGQTVSFDVTTDDIDRPAQSLALGLSNAPVGATLNAGGTFRWPTTEADGPGVYSATIHLSDGSLTVSHTVLMTVTEQNQAPVLAAIADQNVAEGATINFTAVATDSDVPIQTLNYSLSNAPAGAILDGDGAFSWPTTESDDGIYTTTLNVSDGLLTTSQTINLVVTEVNQPPVLAALGNQTVNEGQLVTFTATATDADLSAQLLTYSLTEAPGGAFINGTSGSFTWQTDDADGGGVYTVAILVSDGAFTDSVTFSITVNEVNIAPTFMAPLSAWTVDEGATVSLNATADDPDIPVQTLSYNLSNAPVGMTISDTGRILWYTGEADGPSLHNVTIDAGDGVVTTSQTVAITVTEINQPPQMPVLSDVTVDEGTYISFSAAATDADLPIQALTYTLETYAPAALDSSGVFSWTTTEADGGDVYPIIIYVSDGVITVSQSIAITVTEVNDAPLLAHIDNVTASERSRVSFTAVATDADVPLQQLTYSLGNAPVSATIGSYSGDFAWMTSRGDGPGVYSATVRVSDGLLTTTQAIAISVTDQNDAPVITPSPAQYVIQTLEITLTVEAVDDPDQFLVFSLADAPSGASINHEGNFSWPTTRDDALGVYTMMVLASDYMLTGTQMLTITIIPGNVAPQANPDNYSTLFETPLHVSAEGGVLSNDTDADGGTLYAVLDTTPPSGTLTLFADGALVYTPTAGFVGEDHFVYHASDGISDSVPTTVTVYVVEDIPVITNLALTAAPNELFANGLDEATLTFTATDEFGNGNLFAGYVVTFDWTSGYYPGSVATTLDANGVATTTFTAGNHAGTAAITATVRDGEGEKQANTQIALFANALAGRLTAEFVQNITYTLVVSNADEINIQESMVISGSVPADTELLSVGNGISVITGGDYGWGYVKASGFDLAPGEAYTLTWTVRPLLLVGDIETQGHATSKTARLRLALSNRVSRLLLPLVYRQYP